VLGPIQHYFIFFNFVKNFEKWCTIKLKVLKTLATICRTFTKLNYHSSNVQEALSIEVKTLNIMDFSNPSQFGAWCGKKQEHPWKS
jgi:hypothetical protein